MVSDEGPLCMAIAESLAVASQGSVAAFRDPLHRLQNSIALGIDYLEEVSSARAQLKKVFKLTRGPWGRSAFGLRLKEAGGKLFYS
jgi:hypothetical protein